MRVPFHLILGMAVGAPSLAMAAPVTFTADLITLNGADQFTQDQLDTPGFAPSQAEGTATLILDGTSLSVEIHSTGLEPNQRHAQHIHGRFDGAGAPIDSVLPSPALDSDGDNFVELGEGLAAYGPVILNLFDEDGNFPMADATGAIDYERIFDLATTDAFAANPATGQPFAAADLQPLDLREIVQHGLTVPAGLGSDGGEITGQQDGFIGGLPVDSGVIVQVTEVPEPPALSLFAAGLLGLGYVVRRRGKAA